MVYRHMKRLNITSYQANENQNQNVISPNTYQAGYYKKQQQITSVGQDVERREPTCTLGGNVNCTTMRKNSTEFLQKIKNRTNTCSSISTPRYLVKEIENTN